MSCVIERKKVSVRLTRVKMGFGVEKMIFVGMCGSGSEEGGRDKEAIWRISERLLGRLQLK